MGQLKIPYMGISIMGKPAPTLYAILEYPDTIILGGDTTFKLSEVGNVPIYAALGLPDGSSIGLFNAATSNGSVTVTLDYSLWTSATNQNTLPFIILGSGTNTSQVASATVYAYPSQSMAPTFNLGFSPSSGIIQGVTPVTVAITDESFKYGASCQSRFISANNNVSNEASLSLIPTAAGVVSISATVTDSRGLSTMKTTNMNVTAYDPPKINSLEVQRADEDGNIDPEGTKAKVVVEWVGGSGAGGLTSCMLQYRAVGAGSWTECNVEKSGQAYIMAGEFDTDIEYEFQAIVSDSLKSNQKPFILGKAYYTMDFLAGGEGIAFGQACTEPGFIVGMPMRIQKSIEFAPGATGTVPVKNGGTGATQITGVGGIVHTLFPGEPDASLGFIPAFGAGWERSGYMDIATLRSALGINAHIVASGTSGNWAYVKWSNGQFIAFTCNQHLDCGTGSQQTRFTPPFPVAVYPTEPAMFAEVRGVFGRVVATYYVLSEEKFYVHWVNENGGNHVYFNLLICGYYL